MNANFSRHKLIHLGEWALLIAIMGMILVGCGGGGGGSTTTNTTNNTTNTQVGDTPPPPPSNL